MAGDSLAWLSRAIKKLTVTKNSELQGEISGKERTKCTKTVLDNKGRDKFDKNERHSETDTKAEAEVRNIRPGPSATELTSLYQPLDIESKEIRVLYLVPGAWNDMICCTMETRSLSDAYRKYEALSYVWDAEPGFQAIVVNEQPLSVKRNLFLALRRLRKSNEPRIMWVDALCINQQSNVEKSHQVALMRNIYRSCVRVYLWLGDYSTNPSDTRSVEDEINIFTSSRATTKKKDKRPFHPEILDAYISLVSSPWWDRLWVVQEKILSPECLLNEAMLKSIRKIRDFGQMTDRTKSWMDFYRFILHHRNRKSSDPRDMVYGLSALAPHIPPELIADYSLSKEEIFERLVLLFIKEHGTLHALRGQRTLIENSKSWVYDWSSDVDDRLWYQESMRLEIVLYKASRNKKPVVESCSDGQLSADGVFFDLVAERGQTCDNSPESRIKSLREWYNLCQNASKQMPRSMWREDFLRTVIGDVAYKVDNNGIMKIGMRTPADMKDVFDDWLVYRERPSQYKSTGDSDLAMFDDLVKTMATGLKFFLTEKGYMGLGNPEIGDEVWVLLGGDKPFLLRPLPSSTSHWLIGDCFVMYLEREALRSTETLNELGVKTRLVWCGEEGKKALANGGDSVWEVDSEVDSEDARVERKEHRRQSKYESKHWQGLI
ncbi:HET-domain-containing protein [Mollisia scopiformis]|uniref:HET-domain-containing protein n=1 Tax=Mollisia scopiformis TaxID=149040 RepID=A0A132B3T0_MOLSC|nr:HET-domain-containing protein [Mollisia scopiformis]KUJ07042.1 HET-domain-containing protein [Mollisia scopiformis]